jgi:hypothetical protein
MDQKDQKRLSRFEIERSLNSIPVEINILERLDDYLKEIISPVSDKSKLYKTKTLTDELVSYFKTWQFQGQEKEGLGSGQAGEAFAHLVGLGILEDFPVYNEGHLEENELNSQKENILYDNDKTIKFKVKGEFVIHDKDYFVTFSFNTSKKMASDRLTHLRSERDMLKKL